MVGIVRIVLGTSSTFAVCVDNCLWRKGPNGTEGGSKGQPEQPTPRTFPCHCVT